MRSRGRVKSPQQASVGPPKVLEILSAALVFIFVVGCEPSQVQQHLRQAGDHLAKGDYSLAQEHYSQVLELNPRSAAAYLGRGKSHEGLASPDQAVDDYQRALEIQPDLEEARERLIHVLVDMGNGRQALGFFASSSSPSDPLPSSLLLARGRAQMQVELASEAIIDFDSVLKLEPQNVPAHFYRGLAHSKLEKLSAAEEDFTAVISLDPSHASAFWHRGLIRERRGMKGLAAEDRQKATELDPRMSFADSQIGKNMIESLTGQEGGDAPLESFSKNRR